MKETHRLDSIPTRYSLLSRLEDRGDQDSWRDFFNTYWRLIYSVALKSGLTETEAQNGGFLQRLVVQSHPLVELEI